MSIMEAQPMEIVEKFRAFNGNVDLWSVYDKVDKIFRSVKPLLDAAQNLNVGAPTRQPPPRADRSGWEWIPSLQTAGRGGHIPYRGYMESSGTDESGGG